MDNPFRDDIVSKPRSIEKSISGLNDKPFELIYSRFESLLEKPIPRLQNRISHIQFIVSRDPGYGKSHLLGRLFQQVKGKANLIYITPFQDHATAWKSVLDQIINEMNYSDDLSSSVKKKNQMAHFAHGVLSQLMILYLKHADIDPKKKGLSIKYFQDTKLEEQSAKARSFLKKNIENLKIELNQLNLQLKNAVTSWINVLYVFAYENDFERIEICQEWLKNKCIVVEDANEIGIRSSDVLTYEMSVNQLNENCKNIIYDLCQLASLNRPFLFCFDQTENYGSDYQLAKSLGGILQTINDEFYNQITILTSNMIPWEKSIKLHFEDAQLDRLSTKIELEGINRIQAKEFIRLRLEGIQSDPSHINHLMDDVWLQTEFSHITMGVRHFIKKCRIRWEKQNEIITPLKNMDTIYEEYKRSVQANPKKLYYNQDALIWFINTLSSSLHSTAVISDEKYYRYQLINQSQRIYFGLQDSNNWSTWNALTKRSVGLQNKGIHQCIILRIFNQKPVPKPNWQVAPFINETQENKILNIYALTKEDVISIFAGHDMYKDTVSQNIEYSVDQVKQFLQAQFQPIWDKILKSNAETLPEPLYHDEVKKKIIDIMKFEKFMSLEAIQAKIPNLSTEKIISLQNSMSEINYYQSPTASYLQWLS